MTPLTAEERRRQEIAATAGTDATNLVWTMRMRDIDAAAATTVTWTRRRLLDVTLELAARQVATSASMRRPRSVAPVAPAQGTALPPCTAPRTGGPVRHYYRKVHDVWTCVDCGDTT